MQTKDWNEINKGFKSQTETIMKTLTILDYLAQRTLTFSEYDDFKKFMADTLSSGNKNEI